MKREVLECPNYKDFGKPPALFDPALFDLQAATDRLAAALASTNSVRSGAKKFTMPMGGMGTDALREQLDKMHLKEGQSIKQVWQPENHGFWEETTSNIKDRRRETVCAACGKPGGAELKTCSGCRQILYVVPCLFQRRFASADAKSGSDTARLNIRGLVSNFITTCHG